MNERTRRRVLIGGAIALGLLSIGAGALIAVSDDDEQAAPTSPSPTTPPSPTATEEPSPTEETSPTPPRAVLPDGNHFVYVTDASRLEDGSLRVTLDLAYFYTGAEAQQEAAAHGDEAVNDYYIVNDNPRLRRIPIVADATVRYFPVGSGSVELVEGNLDAWLEAVMETAQTDYGGKDVPWWFTVDDGVVTRIEQQYLP